MPHNPDDRFHTGAGLPRAWLPGDAPADARRSAGTALALGFMVPVAFATLVILVAVAVGPQQGTSETAMLTASLQVSGP